MSLTPRIDTAENTINKNIVAISGNLIINGGFDFWQRGTSVDAQVPSNAYDYKGVDRFQVTAANYSGGATLERSTTVPTNAKYTKSLYFTAPTDAVTAANFGIKQRIESIFAREVVDKNISFYFDYKSDGFAQATVNIYHADAEDDYSTKTLVYTEVVALTADDTWRQVLIENVPAGSNAGNGLEVEVFFENAPLNTAVNLYVGGVMLHEYVGVFVPFQRAGRNYQEELQLCQRYFEKSYDLDTPPGSITSAGGMKLVSPVSGNADHQHVQFQVRKRAFSTVTLYPTQSSVAGNITNRGTGNTSNVNVSAFAGSIGTNAFRMVASLSANTYYDYHFIADAEL